MIRCRAVNIGRFSTRSKSRRDAPVVTLKEGIKHLSKAYNARSAKSDAAPISEMSATFNRMKRIADLIATCELRSSATTYRRARDIPATKPSTHWDLIISSTQHKVKGHTVRPDSAHELPLDLPPLTRMFKREPFLTSPNNLITPPFVTFLDLSFIQFPHTKASK
jgi:hypothetical protein